MKTKINIPNVPEFTLEVDQGIIYINSISLLQATDSVIYLSADCKQKYPGWFGGTFNEVILETTSRTLSVDKRFKRKTYIKMEGLEEDNWRMIDPRCGRYTVNWCYIRIPDNIYKENYLNKNQWVDV